MRNGSNKIIPIAIQITPKTLINNAIIFDNVFSDIYYNSQFDDELPYIIGIRILDKSIYETLICIKLVFQISPVILISLCAPSIILDEIFESHLFHNCELVFPDGFAQLTIDSYFIGCGILELFLVLCFACYYYFRSIINVFPSLFENIINHPVFHCFHYSFTIFSFFWWIVIGWSIRFTEIDIYCEDTFTTFFSIYLGYHFFIFIYDCFLCIFIFTKFISVGYLRD